jgi:hypothetical protein
MEDQALAAINHLEKTGDQTHTWHVSSVSWSLSTAWVVAEQESQSNSLLLDISHTLCKHSIVNVLKALVNIPNTQASQWSLTGMWVTEQWDGTDAATIAQNFGVGLDTAKWTLKAMTERSQVCTQSYTLLMISNQQPAIAIQTTHSWSIHGHDVHEGEVNIAEYLYSSVHDS